MTSKVLLPDIDLFVFDTGLYYQNTMNYRFNVLKCDGLEPVQYLQYSSYYRQCCVQFLQHIRLSFVSAAIFEMQIKLASFIQQFQLKE